mgnify:CR=1 FL=1
MIISGLIKHRLVVDDDPANEVATVELSVSSEGGDEDLVLTESDAWLHGSASLTALPTKDAALTLTLYDEGSASLMSFSGTLGADGSVTLKADEAACEVYTKVGCTSVSKYDVEVLAGEVYASGKGYELTLDLSGADTYEVAYATVVVSGGEKAEVDWDAVGSVWTADSTLEHSGAIDLKAKALDSAGNTVVNVKAELAEPWVDDGEGVNALSAGSGTSVAITSHRFTTNGFPRLRISRMTVVSDGWTTTSYPTHAEVELAGGGTVSVPANSFLRRMHIQEGIDAVMAAELVAELELINANPLYLSIDGASPKLIRDNLNELAYPSCSSGTCVLLVEGAKGYELAVTTYGNDPAKLPSKQSLAVVFYDAQGNKLASETLNVEFASEVTAVFSSELTIDGDPMGGDASGSVSLLGAADEKGKQATLSKGTFYGSFSRDSDGDLALAGYGTDDWATSDTSANATIGDPVECGGEGCDGDWAPPVVLYGVAGVGGKVTKIVVSSGGLE